METNRMSTSSYTYGMLVNMPDLLVGGTDAGCNAKAAAHLVDCPESRGSRDDMHVMLKLMALTAHTAVAKHVHTLTRKTSCNHSTTG